MQNIRDILVNKLVNLTNKIDALLLKQLTDEFVSELDTSFYIYFYDSFQGKIGEELQENLKFDMKHKEPWWK